MKLKDLNINSNVYIIRPFCRANYGIITNIEIIDSNHTLLELDNCDKIEIVNNANNQFYKSYEDMIDNIKYLTSVNNFNNVSIPKLIPYITNYIEFHKTIYVIKESIDHVFLLNKCTIKSIKYDYNLCKWRIKLFDDDYNYQSWMDCNKLGIRIFFDYNNALNKFNKLRGNKYENINTN